MRIKDRLFAAECIARTRSRMRQGIAGSLVLLTLLPCGHAAFAQEPQTGAPAATTPAPQAPDQGTNQAPNQTPGADKPAQPVPTPPAAVPPLPQAPGTTATPPAADQKQNSTPAPLGTAVAPYEKGIGVAASRPAGAVIAPSKQRRTRSFVIKVAVVLGAVAAVGTVVALSSASSSRPN